MKTFHLLVLAGALTAALGGPRVCGAAEAAEKDKEKKVKVSLRRVVPAEQKGMYTYKETAGELDPAKTPVVVVDMWDRHWCKTFTRRVGELVPGMNRSLDAVRKLGIPVVFSPSDVLRFYKDYPQRKAALALPQHEKPKPKPFDPPMPPWCVTGGCECGPDRPCPGGAPWKRQHAELKIEKDDLIVDSNNNQELYNFCAERGITTLVYMGVATNMCLINRQTGVKPMTQLGFSCVLVRDMSFAISGNGYDPDRKQKDPALTPENGSQRVLTHLELFWLPSVDSGQLLKAAGMEKKKE